MADHRSGVTNGGAARGMTRVVVGLVALLGLAGCSLDPYPEIPRDAPSGGQTQAELDATLAGIPGLTVEDAAGSKPNLKGNTGYGFDLILDPGYEVADGVALVDFLVESAWSVRTGYMPNTTIAVRFSGVPGDDFNATIAAIDGGWIPEGSQTVRPISEQGWSSAQVWLNIDGSRAVHLGAIANRERIGEWPGDVPEFPADAIVPRTN